MHYEGNVIRPPSEANSIILQVTVGCSHNHCTFCGAYKDVRFRVKNKEEIDRDISFASRHYRQVKRVFLADGDALILSQNRLESLFEKIRDRLPQVHRISLYGNARAIRSKRDEDLVRLKQRGLDRIYLGVESGDNAVLAAVRKNETADSLTTAGKRVIDAGIFLSTTILLGLAGTSGSIRHAQLTARLLNSMRPNQIAALTLMPLGNTELGRQVVLGAFSVPTTFQLMKELRMLVEHITIDRVQFMANHASNYLPISGRLAKDKNRILAEIDGALSGQIGITPEWRRAL